MNRAKAIRFFDALWTLKEPDPTLLEALIDKDTLIEISIGEPPYAVVFGVPHHAPIGVEKIAENWWDERHNRFGRDSDEGAALYALAAFTELRDRFVPCKLIIFAHSTDHDPNKDLNSPYYVNIFAHATRLLFECHGAGDRRRYDLELSAGQNGLARPLEFGRILANHLDYHYVLATQVEYSQDEAIIFDSNGGESKGKLQLPALETESLVEANRRGIPALHLEAKPDFRKPSDSSNTLTSDGLALGRAIAKSIMQYQKMELPE